MIVKCQRSLETTEDCPQMLFYNRARDWYQQFDLTEDWNKRFGPTMSPDDNRFFARVDWPCQVEPPIFVARLKEQNW